MACINVELTETYIHTNSQQYIYVGRKWTYRASISDKVTVTSDTIVYLSYTGSTALLGTSFNAPSKVTIKSGTFYVDFEIEVIINSSSYQKLINVSGSTTSIANCGVDSIQILSYHSTPKGVNDEIIREPGNDCCLFYDTTHKVWRDYYPTCMGNNGQPKFPGNLEKSGTISSYDWYDSELYN